MVWASSLPLFPSASKMASRAHRSCPRSLSEKARAGTQRGRGGHTDRSRRAERLAEPARCGSPPPAPREQRGRRPPWGTGTCRPFLDATELDGKAQVCRRASPRHRGARPCGITRAWTRPRGKQIPPWTS